MWWWDFAIDSVHTFIKNGLSWVTIAGIAVLLFKNKRIKKGLQKHLPPAFRDYEDERLDLILKQQREILRRLGDEMWPNNDVRHSGPWTSSSVRHKRKSFISCWAESITVRIARHNINYLGRVKKMKWFKPEFLVFVVGAVVVVLNDRFGWGLTQEGVVAFFVAVGGYLLQQGIINLKTDGKGAFAGIKINSRKLIFTLVAAAFIGLNELMELGYSQEVIWTVAALVTGYNVAEGAKDAKDAAAPPTEVHFPAPIGFVRGNDVPYDGESH